MATSATGRPPSYSAFRISEVTMPPFHALFALAAAFAPAPEPTPAPSADRLAIEVVLAQESQAWDRGDAEAFAAPVRPDVVFTNIVGLFSVGREPFLAQHRRIFATIYKGSTMSQTLSHLVFLRSDVAVVDTVTEVRRYQSLPHGMEPIDGALQTRLEQVMVREEGRWRIAAFHNVTVHPAALVDPPGPR